MTRYSLLRSASVALLAVPAALAAPGLAAAQTSQGALATATAAESNVIGEVIVTAQRREESLQRTPVAVTALSAETLRSQNVTSIADVSRMAPNLAISASGYTAPTNTMPIVYIRGIGQQDPAIGSEPGVPVYVDGVYVAKSAGGAIDLPDIARVEVLRGPQGTLFGKNAVGGALSLVTLVPGGTPETRIDLTAGSYDLYEARGVTSLAASETLGLSFAFDLKHQNGYGDRLAAGGARVLGRMGDQRHTSGRIKAHWTPTDQLTIDLSVDHTRYRDTATPGQTVIVPSNLLNLWNANVGSRLGTPITQAGAASGRYDNFSLNPQPAHDNITGESAAVAYDLGGVTLKSITAYREVKQFFDRDADASAPRYIEISRRSSSRQFSQELQLSGKLMDDRLNYIVGAFYLHDDSDEYNTAYVVSGLFNALRVPGFDISRDYNDTQTTESYAVFAQGSFAITDRLNLTAGVRYTDDKKDATVFVDGPESGIVYVPKTRLKDSWDSVTPRISLDYQATDDILVYGSASKGFKSGGFNERPATLVSLTQFNPETVWSYEAGLKADLFNHHVRANTAVFLANYDNIQLARQILDPVTRLIISDVSNVASSRIKGVEVELTVVPVRGLELSSAVGYTHNKYTKVQPGAVVTPASKIPYAPAWTGSVSARYVIDLGDLGTLTPSANYAFRSGTYVTPINTAFSHMPAYQLVSARMAYAPVKGHWDLSLYGTNLTNKRYLNSVGDSNGIGIIYEVLGRPREVGATLGIHF